MRSVPEWRGKTDDAKVPPRVRLREHGRGVRIPVERLEEIEKYCFDMMRSGCAQQEICAVLNASRSRVSRWCKSAIMKYGDPSLRRLLNTGTMTLSQMMWSRIDVRSPDECWPWLGFVKPNGYGSLNFQGVTRNAHRLVYETLIADIPDGAVVDHKCGNRGCVNPRHLQLTTQHANVLLARTRMVTP
jgi:DNA-binding CsgD family transcriptional regulator